MEYDLIRYCNEVVRRMADWVVSTQNFRAIAPPTIPDGEIEDGARVDGRPIITGELVRAFLAGDLDAARAIAVNPAKAPVVEVVEEE
jgi:hypothetical protein